MKNLTNKFVITLALLALGFVGIQAQNGVTVAAESEAAGMLDLYAVAELFKDSENLEKFEQSLNDSKTGINNLDLNKNGEIDFIRITEQTKDDTRLIILQSILGENDFQDVATIAVERETGGKYNLQIQGDTAIYGADYYVVPAGNNFSAWNVVRWLFRPNYRVYDSPFGFGNYPRYWAVRRPVAFDVYRNRTVIFGGRKNFVTSRTVRVKNIGKINYRPRTSTLVIRKAEVVRRATPPGTVTRTNTVTTTRQNPAAQTTTTKKRTVVIRKGKH